MGATRIIVPFVLFATAIALAVIGLMIPAGVPRISMLAAAGLDFLIGGYFLLFGVPERR